VAFLPFLAHFGVVDGGWKWGLFAVNPGHAMLRALSWAADPSALPVADRVYAFSYMTLLIAVFFRRAMSIYATDRALRAG
jgi:fluoroquinolone transport system permease protein